MRMKIFIRTRGCTYNHADSDGLKRLLRGEGFKITGADEADVIVFNTCAVKEATQTRALYAIRKEEMPLVVTGCLAQTMPELVEKANPKASIIGTFSQTRVPEAARAAAEGKKIRETGKHEALENAATTEGAIGRIKISQGCLGGCSFCQTKLARGTLKSFGVAELRRVAREQIAKGAKELQLTSQDCACYGFDAGTDAAELLDAVSGLEGSFRVRLGMGNPEHFREIFPKLLEAMASRKVYKFIHVPVQSGSDRVLKKMNRPYAAEDFTRLVSLFRRRFPDGLVETDVIVGFPGETAEDFKQTLDVLGKTRPDMVNVSKYSARPKTPAARMPQLDRGTIKERSEACSGLCRKIAKENNTRFIGTTLEVLAVEPARTGVMCRSDCYRPVVLERAEIGERYRATVTEAGNGFLRGEISQ